MTTQTADGELKARHRTMWASGDYPHMVETFLLPLGPRLVEALPIEPGTRVLDVAAGTGNASIPAAQRGATVTASDLTPELLDAGSARPEAAGLDLTWTPADAEALPFDDASYDVVMSSIGVMFAPHHQAAADELVRVCRPGGTIGLLSWTPEGMLGALFAMMKPFAPPPPPGASPPPLWGSEEHLRGLFGGRVELHNLEKQTLEITAFPTPATTASTSRPTTAPPSLCVPTPSAKVVRRSSTRPSRRSARPGTAALPVQHVSRRSTSSRSAPAPDRSPRRAKAGVQALRDSSDALEVAVSEPRRASASAVREAGSAA